MAQDFVDIMGEMDENRKAFRDVEKITDSAPVKGEDLVESEDLKRKFRKAKERLRKPIGQ